MGKPFERTMGIVNDNLKPAIKLFRASNNVYNRLIASSIDNIAGRYEDVASAMTDRNRKVALFEFGLTPQLFYAFDCAPLCLETFPMFYTRVDANGTHAFIDAAAEAGIPSEVCSTDRFIAGTALLGEMPDNSFYVSSSAPCDGTRFTYPIIQKLMDTPSCYIETPYTCGREAARWYAGQIKTRLIPFLEDVTGIKFDIDRFREIIEESNRAYELLVDITEIYTMKPSPHTSLLRTMPYLGYVISAGHPEYTESLKPFHEDLTRRAKEGQTQGPFEEKHRLLWAHVPPTFDGLLFTWMEDELGATMVASSLSTTPILEPIDTTSLDTMLEGYAWQGLDMTMSIMRFTTPQLIDFTMQAYHRYNCDCIVLSQHVGCNNICGITGLFRKYLREKDIPSLFIELDYNDSRILSSEPLRGQLEEFFTTIMA